MEVQLAVVDWLPLPTPPALRHQDQRLPPLGCEYVCGVAS